MPNAAAASASAASTSPPPKKTPGVPEKKYKCQFCSRAFSRSEHRSRHERSHTKERPFKCMKCRSTFVRRDLLLRHDRTVHAKDGGAPLVSEGKRRTSTKTGAGVSKSEKNNSASGSGPGRPGRPAKAPPVLDPATLEQIEASSDGNVDLETAAMLITDLHHKATASHRGHHRHRHSNEGNGMHDGYERGSASSSAEAADGGPSTPYSPEHTTMFDNGVGGYLANANLPLAQLPWDAFMPHAVRGAHPPLTKAQTLRSQVSHSQSSSSPQLPFNGTNPSGTSTHPAHLLDRYPHDALHGPLLPSVDDRVGHGPASGSATPNGHHASNGARGLSPFPFLLGPVSPVDYRRSPGPSQALVPPRVPQIDTDEDFDAMASRIREAEGDAAGAAAFPITACRDANEYLTAYFARFHHHLPFLHAHSFDPTMEAPPPLLLAALSLGALCAGATERAFVLHIGSKQLVSRFLQDKEEFSSRKCPLWLMQATLLNMVFASWSGDPKGLEWACSIKSLLANMVAGNRYELQLRADARGDRPPTHAEWIEDEGCRRTYFAVYIFFGLLTLTYNHTPALAYAELADLALPSSESLWTLPASAHEGEDGWRDALAGAMIPTVRSAHDALFQGEAVRYSALATRVMITALFLEAWSHTRRSAPLQDVVAEYRLRLALETWERSLELCAPETVVVAPHPFAPAPGAPRGAHPLIFNALAVYRNARARLEVDLKDVQEALRYHDPYEVAAAMTRARDGVKRSQEMVRVVEECFDCIEGAALARSTAIANGAANGHGNSNGAGIGIIGPAAATARSAASWSVEHPLCGCDLMVILSLWLYRLEHDEEEATEEELGVYNRIRNLLDDGAVDAGAAKLSATVARLWGEVLEEVVVWGITKVMGEAFQLHAQALSGYDDAAVSGGSATSTPTMSPAPALEAEMDTDAAVY